jgi:excisionase family DNA binding protein
MNRSEIEHGERSEPRYVSTATVADALGVSVTTVKRWVDDGVLPAHRTAGGHRKLLVADVYRLVRSGSLPYSDLTRLIPTASAEVEPADAVRQRLIAAINAEDHDLVRTILLAAYRNGMPMAELADRVIAPAFAHVGHSWQAGNLTVSAEHRITQACVATLYELRAELRVHADPDRPVAVGGAPEHDHYILPTLLAKLTLLEGGWDAINLGPHTPMSALVTTLDDVRPTLVWLSVTHLADPERFADEYTDFFRRAETAGVAVAIGGQGLGEALRGRLPYTTFGDGLGQLASFAKTLRRPPPRPKRGRPPLHG